ncbi:MAG TPA: YbaK/EbsC family protein [Gaiellaceae bacterium]|nr:YbaK/EbsC family protein [Gaiellaceae bacterium]
MSAWPEPVERVARVLREAQVEARIEEFADGTPTAEAAAQAVGCELGQIVKSLVFRSPRGYVVALVPGDRRADRTRVAREAGVERVKTAGPEEVLRATGFDAGGVAPFPLPGVELVLADRRLLAQREVWFGAGTHSHMAALHPAELVRLARAREADVSEEPRSRSL